MEILTLAPQNPNTDNLRDARLMVTMSQDQDESRNTAIPLNDFLDAASTIGTLSHPLTEIRLELPTLLMESNQTFSGPTWLGSRHPENDWVWSPHRVWHIELQRLFAPYKKQIRYVMQGREPGCNSLELCDAHEIKTLQTHRPERLTKTWFAAMTLALASSPIRRSQRIVGVAVCVAGCLGVWHGIPVLRQSFSQEAAEVISQHLNQHKSDQALHDWAGWQNQVVKFGNGKLANIKRIRISWQSNGEIDSLVEIQRPRKRLPKGCQASPSPDLAICTVTPTDNSFSSGTPWSTGTRSRLSVTSGND